MMYFDTFATCSGLTRDVTETSDNDTDCWAQNGSH